MARQSAGILLFRENSGRLEVFLVHPGGPLWEKKDAGAWSIPKGELQQGEDPLAAAKREFEEETGLRLPAGELIRLESIRQAGGKLVHALAVRGDVDPSSLKSNRFHMQWPPKSGRQAEFPEVDRAAWFSIEEAERRISKSQVALLHELRRKLAGSLGFQEPA